MSLTVRLALTYLLITLVGVLILGGALLVLVERTLTLRNEQALAAQAQLSAALLAELAGSAAELPTVAGAVSGSLPAGATARVFSNAGVLLSGTGELGPFPSRAALALIRSSVPLPASQAPGRQYSASAIAGPGGPIGVVEISRDGAEDAQLLRDLRKLIGQAAVGAALVMGLVSIIISRAIARPIKRLTRRADVLAQSVAPDPAPQPMDFQHAQRDEVQRLAAGLDRLEAALNARLTRIGELEQARARFYRSVSHELRTPLTAIRAGLENLADGGDPAQGPAFARLEAEAARLGRLMDELLQPPADGNLALDALTIVDLGALVTELAALLAGRARRAGVQIACTAPEGIRVNGDRDRLKQAVLNLIDNALRVTPPGGTVTLQVAATNGRAQVRVIDTGPGVAPDEREVIWNYGTRGSHAGSAGVGLALVRAIAEAHGGGAELDAAYGPPGAQFVIVLPLVRRQEDTHVT
jgi:signal transduction histidine kinase